MDFYDQVAEMIEGDYEPDFDFEKYDANKIRKALSVLFTVICVNSISAVVLSIIFGPTIGSVAFACIIAPITEEFGKRASIKGHYEKEYFIAFNATEFTQYVTQMSRMGAKISKAIILRAVAAGMHLSTTIVQWIFNNEKVQKKLGIDKDDHEGKQKASFIGTVCGMLIHGCWNTSAVKFGNKMMNYVMK